mmetsp:Transcript_5795/g.11411  ORF Transcript_5795/g.11411 Transcript_5795/m.11411 type:complete len:217 (-) Transcript_5795:3468-4118(-)
MRIARLFDEKVNAPTMALTSAQLSSLARSSSTSSDLSKLVSAWCRRSSSALTVAEKRPAGGGGGGSLLVNHGFASAPSSVTTAAVISPPLPASLPSSTVTSAGASAGAPRISTPWTWITSGSSIRGGAVGGGAVGGCASEDAHAAPFKPDSAAGAAVIPASPSTSFWPAATLPSTALSAGGPGGGRAICLVGVPVGAAPGSLLAGGCGSLPLLLTR